MVERVPSQNSRDVSGSTALTTDNKPDNQPYKPSRIRQIKLTRRQYQIFYYLTKTGLTQTEIAKKLRITRQTINEHVKNLLILGVIKPIKSDANPKHYKSTYIVPTTDFSEGRKTRITINKNAKVFERRVGKPLKTVRDHRTGHFKGKREARGEGFKRDYDTIVSLDGKRVVIWRLNALSYSCRMLNVPVEKVPWEPRKGPNGMEQEVFHHDLSNNKSEIDFLKKMNVTFMHKKTATTNELVIYLPEMYLLDYELDQAKVILQEYIWMARKWFQKTFKAYLSMPIEYRPMEIAREIVDPRLKNCVHENGMIKIKTKRGYAMVDESKKGFPEVEHTTIEQARADLESADRILDLEAQMAFMMEQQKKTNAMIQDMAKAQEQFHNDIQEFMGFRRKLEKKLEKDNINIYE